MDYKYGDYVLMFKALSDETRLQIIDMLSEKELCACHILEKFNITQPTLSYHMKILKDGGIVNCSKNGSWMNYSLNEKVLDEMINLIKELGKIN